MADRALPQVAGKIARQLAEATEAADERDARIVELARKGYPTEAIADQLGLSPRTVRRVRAEYKVAGLKQRGPVPMRSSTCPKCGERVATARVDGRPVLVDIEVREQITFRRGTDEGSRVVARSTHGPTCIKIQLARERARDRAAREG